MPEALVRTEPQLERLVAAIRHWFEQKGKVWIKYGPPKRSLDQNSYLWGYAYPPLYDGRNLREQGYTVYDMHEFLLGEFTGWRHVPGLGRRPNKTSSEMNTVEFSDYILFVQQFAAERGIYVPDPNETT